MKIHIITELEENLKISETTKWRHSMEKKNNDSPQRAFTQAALTVVRKATADAALTDEVPSRSESKRSCC